MINPTIKFSGASNEGKNTKIKQRIMNMIGMIVLTRIGRGRSGLKIKESIKFVSFYHCRYGMFSRLKQTLFYAAKVKQQYWQQQITIKFD